MKTRRWMACGLAAAAFACSATPAMAANGDLDAYRVEATGENLRALADAGFDVTEGRDRDRGTVDVVGTARSSRASRSAPASSSTTAAARRPTARARLTPEHRALAGRPDRRRRTPPTPSGASTTRSTSRRRHENASSTRSSTTACSTSTPTSSRSASSATTYGGREIVALQVTKDPTGADIAGTPGRALQLDAARPRVARRRDLQAHAQLLRRQLRQDDERRPRGHAARRQRPSCGSSASTTRTATSTRSPPATACGARTCATTTTTATIELGDGVDPNRNFSANWGRDDEGSSPRPDDGDLPRPEPGLRARDQGDGGPVRRDPPGLPEERPHGGGAAAVPAGLPAGHADARTTRSSPRSRATRSSRASRASCPSCRAGLYITNGDFTDWAYSTQKTLSYTPEGTEAEDPDVTGFEYPDSEQQIQQEFRRHLPFVLDLAKSADDPTEPVSHLGNKADDFTVDSFAVLLRRPAAGAGDRQAQARRRHDEVQGQRRPRRCAVPTKEFTGGERYYKNDAVYYHRVRGFVSGTKPGDTVEVWFTRRRQGVARTSPTTRSPRPPTRCCCSPTRTGRACSRRRAAVGPGRTWTPTRPLLDAQGIELRRLRRRPRTAWRRTTSASSSHYSHVVWYTGDDYVPREPDAPGGSGITKLAVDTQNRVRDFLNDGGKLFYTGQNAGRVYAEGYTYNPFQVEEGTYCQNANPTCIAVQDDFLQYWLGANTYVGGGGKAEDGSPLTISGFADPFDDRTYTMDPTRRPRRPEDPHTAALLVTSSIYDPEDYPQWADSQKVLAWDRPGASPFEPFTGDWFMSAGTDDVAYKRLPARGRPDRRDERDVVVPDVVRPRGGLRLHVRRDPHRRARTTGRRWRRTTAQRPTTRA